jgi:hypothetical protein
MFAWNRFTDNEGSERKLETDEEMLIVHRIEMKIKMYIELKESKMKPNTKENWHMLN